MSKAQITEKLDAQLGNLTIEQAATIEYVGKILKEQAWSKHGQYLDSDARSDNGKKPMSVAETMDDLSITIGNQVLTVKQDKDNAPIVSTPFGLSDRITQASLPKDWMIQSLYQFIIDCNGGDTAFAEQVQGFINDCLDFATIHNDDGSIQKIDASKLPTPAMAVLTSDMVTSHKRQTISKAKGSTTFNIDLVIEQDDSVIPRIPVRNTGFVATPNSPIAPTPATSQAPRQVGQVADEDLLGNGPVAMVDEGADNTVGVSASDLLQSVIGDEPMTKGDIRKAVCEQIAEPLWVAELESLVDAGVVVKTTNGGPRSTRYTMGVSA